MSHELLYRTQGPVSDVTIQQQDVIKSFLKSSCEFFAVAPTFMHHMRSAQMDCIIYAAVKKIFLQYFFN